MKKTITISLVILSVTAALVYKYHGFFSIFDQKELHVAIIGPMSGPQETVGRSLVQGAELYIHGLNKKGGINHHKVVLDIFDDQNNPEIAQQKALEIVKEKQVLAVIGHNFSSCSIAAGKVYRNQLPAITPTSTNVQVTAENDWYFRTIFNDKDQGRYLAHYIKNVLKQNRVSIIQEEEPYGSYLSKEFELAAQSIGLEIKKQWHFSRNSASIDKDLQSIVFDLMTHKRSAGIIFMPVHATEGGKLVQMMRDKLIKNTVIGADSLSSKLFVQGFKNLPKEKRKPGYYTDGVYATSHLIYDTANLEAQRFKEDYLKVYKENPDWQSASAYDAVMLLTESIKKGGVEGDPETIDQDRKKIRDYLAKIVDYDSVVEGVTGVNYFDSNGDVQKSVIIGIYKKNSLISAPTQFKSIPNIQEFHQFKEALLNERVKLFEDGYKARVNVVYSGLDIREIKSLDTSNLTFELDFDLWFRYQGELDVGNIEFLNLVEPISLGEPIVKQNSEQENYELYHVNGLFKADFLQGYYRFGQHTLGISFRHRALTTDNLVYVTDFIGMGFTEGNPLMDKIRSNQVFNPVLGWSANNVFFYQDLFQQHSLGNPESVNVQDGTLKFSRFNMGIQIGENTLSLRRVFPLDKANWAAIISAIVLVILFVFRLLWKVHEKIPGLLWLLEAAAILLLLLAVETILFEWLGDGMDIYLLDNVKTIFDVAWWVVPALLLIRAIECFLWLPIEEKTASEVPSIVRNIVVFLVITLAALGVLAFVYDQKITSLLATSGVLAMVIGLAIQVNLSNIFSGIAIGIEQPFKIGDWIKVGDSEAGQVVQMTWRSVRLMNNTECMYSMPNSVVAESKVLNYHGPNDHYLLYFFIHIDPIHPPDKVMQCIMNGLLESEPVIRLWGPFVRMTYAEASIVYIPIFTLKDYGRVFADKNVVSKNVWRHLKRAGITPSVRRQQVFIEPDHYDDPLSAAEPYTVLNDIPVLQMLPVEVRGELAERLQPSFVSRGSFIYREKEQGKSMFLIASGLVSLCLGADNTENSPELPRIISDGGLAWDEVEEDAKASSEVISLGAGNIIGGISFVTGEQREIDAMALTDCVLFEIHYEDLQPILAKHPETAAKFNEYIMLSVEELKVKLNNNGTGQGTESKKKDKLIRLKNLMKMLRPSQDTDDTGQDI